MMQETLLAFDPAVLATFIVAGLLLNMTPGADFVFVSASGIAGGPKAGMAAGLGITLGTVFHVAAAALGISALLMASPYAYDAIRYLGAAYLLWLAVHAWRSQDELSGGKGAGSMSAALKRGFRTNILNPKVALFIMAFLPQFTDPDIGPIWHQILILGAIFIFFGTIFILLLGCAAGVFANMLRRHVGALNKITAILFGGLAARLIID